ncbi:MAG TPA: AraC family transcriptional regulator [Candidatus Ozemobacteraceae bacterium]|nr:AraC family transcriptional regulator [Candidatus Ozemobacteraceae bacterium]
MTNAGRRSSTIEQYRERVQNVLDHIQADLDQVHSLDELAQLACFSPFQFHRVFRGMVGEPVAEYIRRLRLERAGLRLLQSRRTVTDIAFEAGYQNLESFIRAFRQRFGQPPSRFRRLREEQACRLFARDSLPGSSHFSSGGNMDVQIIHQAPRTVASVRYIGPYKNCGKAWEALCNWAGQLGLIGPDTQFIGLCYDDPDVTPADKIRYDACITLDRPVTPGKGVTVQEIPGGAFAKTLHLGPMEKLSETYVKLCGKWLPQSGREMKHAPNLEIYLNDPDKTPPEELRIEIQLPLEDA